MTLGHILIVIGMRLRIPGKMMEIHLNDTWVYFG